MAQKRDLAGIIFFALFLRAIFVWFQTKTHFFALGFISPDGLLYDALARSLMEGKGFQVHGEPTAFVSPLYPLFLMFVYKGIGSSPLVVGFVQSVLGAVSCGLLYLICSRLFSRPVARLAGIGAALYPHLIFWTGYLLTETLFIFFVLLLLWSAVRAFQSGQALWYGMTGLCLVLGGLTRPVLLGFVPLLFLFFLGHRSPRPFFKAFLFILCFLVPLLPWGIRNRLVLGRWIWGSSEGGYVLYMGNSVGATGGTRGYVDHADFANPPIPGGLSEVEKNEALWRLAVRFIQERPLRFLALSTRKFANMWRPTYEGASWRNKVVMGGSYFLLMLPAIAGLLQGWRGNQRGVWILYLYLLYYVGIHMVVIGMIRFRVGAEPVLIAFAASFISNCWRREREVFIP